MAAAPLTVGRMAGLGSGWSSASNLARHSLSISSRVTRRAAKRRPVRVSSRGTPGSGSSARRARAPWVGSVMTSSMTGCSGLEAAAGRGCGRLSEAIWRPKRRRPARRGSIWLVAMRRRTSPMESWMAPRSSGRGQIEGGLAGAASAWVGDGLAGGVVEVAELLPAEGSAAAAAAFGVDVAALEALGLLGGCLLADVGHVWGPHPSGLGAK